MSTPLGVRRSPVARAVAGTAASLALLGLVACSSNEPEAGATAPAPAPATSAPAAPGPSSTPTETLAPAPTTPVAPPTPGSVDSEVPTRPEQTKKAVDLGASSEDPGKVRAQITKVDAIEATARGAGEVAGPALALTVRLQNLSSTAVDLDDVVVTLVGADGAPGEAVSTSPAKPFAGTLRPDRSASGVYAFTIAKDDRSPVTVQVTAQGGGTVLVYRGNA